MYGKARGLKLYIFFLKVPISSKASHITRLAHFTNGGAHFKGFHRLMAQLLPSSEKNIKCFHIKLKHFEKKIVVYLKGTL
jgi:hypothetical protein